MSAEDRILDRSDLPRVFHDANAGSWDYGYYLWFEDSKAALATISGGPKEGQRVLLYFDGEYEVEALLKRDDFNDCWVAVPVKETLVYPDTGK